MGSQFTVQPDALSALGAQFESEAQQIAAAVKTFSGQASEIGLAFGLVGACDGALKNYKAMLASTQKGLAALVQVITQDGQGLQSQAQQYQKTDGAIASGTASGQNSA
jgi:uncharacterized protein YukE